MVVVVVVVVLDDDPPKSDQPPSRARVVWTWVVLSGAAIVVVVVVLEFPEKGNQDPWRSVVVVTVLERSAEDAVGVLSEEDALEFPPNTPLFCSVGDWANPFSKKDPACVSPLLTDDAAQAILRRLCWRTSCTD